MKLGIYPGSFDPITKGHIDIISRLNNICDELVVLVASSQKKEYLFSLQERVQLAKDSLKSFSHVRVDSHDGLVVDYAKENNAGFIIRGVRGAADWEYEMTMSTINKKLNADIETLIIPASPEYSFVASMFVKEVAYHHGNLSELVPENIEKALIEKYKK